MAGFDDGRQQGAAVDFSPGAQVPLSAGSGQSAATQALASGAYRDGPVSDLLKANGEASVKPPKLSLFEPNLGEAFSRAVQVRMLGGGRAPLIQSFGTDPQVIADHCLAASRFRKARDARLTAVMGLLGLLFLPGVLLWLGGFQLRRWLAGAQNKRAGAFGVLALAALAAVVLLVAVTLPVGGFLAIYLRVMLVAPVVGWFLAKRICERYAKELRECWMGLLSGGGVGARIPETVPQDPNDADAERLRKALTQLAAEQNSNLVFYAGPKGILGMGTRWGSWQLAEELTPSPDAEEINPFRSWDVIRAIQDQLRMLERGPLHTGGFPKPSIRHWIVAPVSEGAKAVSRPEGQEVEAYQVKDFEIQRICNEQQFGSGNRHYLGVQFVLWDGQLVLTLLISVTVLHHTLRIEVTGHALGPVHPLFTTKPAPKAKQVSKTVKFWETKSVPLPLVDTKEVVRLAARAPLTWFPPVLDFLGGKLTLPEPFGLRHTWADKPWRHRFMADDALRAATPVLRVVHTAALKVLEDNGVATEKFGARSQFLSGAVQAHVPTKADEYNA
ncbi:hypothetical protein [Streptomyces alkaliterrae]|uniref:Uncharacterized protein n=1 Tax=Streptomyces alkaliterrae TaxID=2213162 RepID=A0A5P0YQ46_9ACTN|nr:hypothetical protein [Streptomyces alkaliterrae]MBB1254744.1 hypothetical protein [Streptomyces alkaliterrae]MBB1260388.1 hypothetical protein [Streptomyces alkaliterrae]MQS02473.1 hypothetical protein [Streptomyces alkaliterrae]